MHAAIIANDLTGVADTAQMVAAVVRPLTISLRTPGPRRRRRRDRGLPGSARGLHHPSLAGHDRGLRGPPARRAGRGVGHNRKRAPCTSYARKLRLVRYFAHHIGVHAAYGRRYTLVYARRLRPT